MKRLVTLFIALIYLGMSTGFVMNSHYCMGKLSSIELGRSEVKKCICGMRIDRAKKSNCCHSKLDVVKLQEAHKTAPSVLFQFSVMEAVVPQFCLRAVEYTNIYNKDNYLKKLPPNLHQQDIYKRVGVFLI